MASHHPPQHHPHPPNALHHSQYSHHARQPTYSHDPSLASQNGPGGPHSRQLPPLNHSPSSYGASRPPPPPQQQQQQEAANLPPLSPYSQRAPPYSQSQNGSYPGPSMSRQPSGQHSQQPPNARPPPPSNYPSQHPPGPPPLYHATSSSSSQGHWEQPGHAQAQRRESMDLSARRKPSMSGTTMEGVSPPEIPSLVAPGAPAVEENGPAASDFVKKLARMLDDQTFAHVVCWGPKGDCFVVKDMTEFTKTILPRMFKHSNFASFVRQLNKYDFHKIKNPDDSFGDQSWTFHHPDFQRSNREALENIKRKVPAQKKGPRPSAVTNNSGTAGPSSPPDAGPPPPAATSLNGAGDPNVAAMQAQIDQLQRSHDEMTARVAKTERNYQNVLNEMVAFQKGMASQDQLMQSLITHFLNQESGKARAEPPPKPPSVPVMEAPKTTFLGAVPNLNYSSSATSIDSNATLVNPTSPPELSPVERSILARQESAQRLDELRRARETAMPVEPPSAPYLTTLNPAAAAAAAAAAGTLPSDIDPRSGLRVFSNGQIMPAHMQPPAVQESMAAAAAAAKANAAENAATDSAAGPAAPPGWGTTFAPHIATDGQEEAGSSNYAQAPSAGPSIPISASILNSPGTRRFQFGKAFTPGWAIPPRVLLVDDDQVSRKLFSKFLQVSGCTIDVAVDGIGAVNKMNLEKYDLVLMDIVMPKLDGVSATSLIRQFDHMTPIISMTSNSKPNDVVTYYSSGMNDILPKPFTRETLFTMLEKHLVHLKAISQLGDMSGVAPDGGINITDDQYSAMVANLLGMNGDVNGFASMGAASMADTVSQKRPLDLGGDDDRDMKRPRFEVVE